MAIREFLQITQENVWGQFNSAPVRYPASNFNQICIRLDDSNAFTMRPEPIKVKTMYGGGYATRAYTVSDKQQLQGALRLKLCYSQAAILLGMALQNVTATPLPWVTDQPIGDLASVTIDHGYFYDNTSNTFKRRRYLGVKVASGRFEISGESQQCTYTAQLVGGTPQSNAYDSSVDPDLTVFPFPGPSDLPFDYVLFTHSGGLVTIGSAITKYEGLNIDFMNKMDMRYFASHFVQEMRSLGREMTLEAPIKLDSTPNFRAQFEGLTQLTSSVGFNNGTNSITMNFNANSILDKLDDDLQIDKIYFRNASVASQFDPNASPASDFAIAFT